MGNISHRAKFERMDNAIWKQSKIDKRGQTTLPLKLRKKLGLCGGGQILWISINHKTGKDNEFVIEVAVRKEDMHSKNERR